jgi:serine/threonine-protein kinase HipA
MYKPVEVIEVLIWGKRVGAVAMDPKLGFYVFEYEPKFITSKIELSPINMPLEKGHAPFVFSDLPPATYRRLPAMLADALPDDFGNKLIDAWMAQKGVDKAVISPLDRLAYMSKRGMGALEFRPARGTKTDTTTAIQLSKLVADARQMTLYGELDTDHHAKAALAQIIQVGTSAGGARAKAIIAWNPKNQEIRAGQFDVEPGFEHWLIKLDGVGKDQELGMSQNYGRIEFAYSLMAKAAGIAMSPCRLLEENGRAHFMTKRFDRDNNQKIHMQSLCAIAHLDYKLKATHDYGSLFLTIHKLKLGIDALEEAYRRMVFNVMSANCDDHSKNFSFLLKELGEWELSPAYDVTHAYNPSGEWNSQHLMSVNGKFSEITQQDFKEVADRFAIGRAQRIIKQVATSIAAWPEFAKKAGLPRVETEIISEHHKLHNPAK